VFFSLSKQSRENQARIGTIHQVSNSLLSRTSSLKRGTFVIWRQSIATFGWTDSFKIRSSTAYETGRGTRGRRYPSTCRDQCRVQLQQHGRSTIEGFMFAGCLNAELGGIDLAARSCLCHETGLYATRGSKFYGARDFNVRNKCGN
jgi:hypothetical protein